MILSLDNHPVGQRRDCGLSGTGSIAGHAAPRHGPRPGVLISTMSTVALTVAVLQTGVVPCWA